jgi:hypothetical protein
MCPPVGENNHAIIANFILSHQNEIHPYSPFSFSDILHVIKSEAILKPGFGLRQALPRFQAARLDGQSGCQKQHDSVSLHSAIVFPLHSAYDTAQTGFMGCLL